MEKLSLLSGLGFLLFAVLAKGAEDNMPVLACRPDAESAGSGHSFLRDGAAGDYAVPEGAVIGDVRYTRLNVFDLENPDENNALFRWANSFHILTREYVVQRQALFAPGESYDARRLEETARLLRRQDNFFDVDVLPVSLCNERVDIEVITRDTWSFTPGLSYDRAGGENTWSFRVEESNLLGLGKQIILDVSSDIDRDSTALIYQDNNVWGSRNALQATWTESDDGSNHLLDLGLPFFELESERSWNLYLQQREREERQFFRGEEISEVRHDLQDYRLEFGASRGLRNGWVKRLAAGLRYRRNQFGPTADLPAPANFPVGRDMKAPYLRLEWIEDNFATAFNLDRMYRTEDLHLGIRLATTVDFAAAVFGSDQNRMALAGSFSDTLRYTGSELLQHSLSWDGFWNLDQDRAEDLLLTYQARYFHRQSSGFSFFANLEAAWSENLNGHRQVVLGGQEGARGFKNRIQTGDSSLILNLEERYYSNLHLFNLIHVGAAVFLDAGRVFSDGSPVGTQQPWLVDAGFGLRLASSKASSNRVLHIDFAFPLTNRNDNEVDSVLIAINVKGAF